MKALARWSARTPVSANVLMILILAGGLLSLMSMRRELVPEFEMDIISISVPYPGASPEEIEEGICVKIEEQIDGIDGIKKITSSANENVGSVVAELESDADQQNAYNDIKNRIDQITTFPLEAEEPVISRSVISRAAINVAVFGSASEFVLRDLAEEIRDELTAAGGITEANLAGARDYEISIEVSETNLRRYGLSFDDVSRAVERASLDLPAGLLKTRSGDILLRAKGQRYRGREYEDIPLITLPEGAIITLGQVASVIDGFEDADRFSRYKGERAVTIQVMQTGKEDIIEVAEIVREYVNSKRSQLPAGLGIEYYQDTSKEVQDQLNIISKNGFQGFVLVFLVLWLFLRWRLAFWVALGIPISFMGAFWILNIQDATLNVLTLFGFIVALGIVVDDAIIVGENIHSHHRQGASPFLAAVDGTAQVGWPVVIAVLTSIVAFCPLFFVSGMMGNFLSIMPLAVIASLLISLVEAFLILPSHLRESLEKESVKETEERVWSARRKIDRAIERFIEHLYTPFLKPALRKRYITVAATFGVLVVSIGLITGGRLQFVLFPKLDSNNLFARIVFPLGTPSATTEAALQQIEDAIGRVEKDLEPRLGEGERVVSHVVSLLGQIGGQGRRERVLGGHVGQISVELLPAEQRSITSAEIIENWREATGEIAGFEQLTFEKLQGGPAGIPIEIQLLGHDLEDLEDAAEELKTELSGFAGVFDIRDNYQRGKWECKVKAREGAKRLGLTLNDIARQIRQGFYGDEAVRIQRGRDDIKVMVRYPAADRRSRSAVEKMRIRTSGNKEVPLLEVADIEFGRGYSTIRRVNRKRAITVTADIDENAANAQDIIAALSLGYGDDRSSESGSEGFLMGLDERYRGLSFDLEGQAAETQESLSSLLNGFIYALIAIYCLLAALFRSYSQPMIVMCAIPIAMIGAIWGHVFMGIPITLLSLFGIVALSGVVVNDSLVLIDFINREMSSGTGLFEAVVHGGQARFRAIILTSATTIAGLAPMLLESSFRAQFLIPMAVSLAFGLLVATALTLVVTPCVFMIVADVKTRLGLEITKSTGDARRDLSLPV